MIVLVLGLQGSGKTASCVREIAANQHKVYFSNIVTKRLRNNIIITPEMIIKSEIIQDPKNEKRKLERITVNREFWEQAKNKYGSLNIIIDEAHTILNARTGMSKRRQIVNEWLAMLRRVLGSSESGYGRLFLITQLERRVDIVAKEQSTQCRYHVCFYWLTCKRCKYTFEETNETPEPREFCPKCRGRLVKHHHRIMVYCFQNHAFFNMWYYDGIETAYKKYYINDIERIFPNYDTLQWDNLLSDIY